MKWVDKILAEKGAEQSAPKPITTECDKIWVNKILKEKAYAEE